MLGRNAFVLSHHAGRRWSQFTQVKRRHDAYLQAVACRGYIAIFWALVRILLVVMAFDEHCGLCLLVLDSI